MLNESVSLMAQHNRFLVIARLNNSNHDGNRNVLPMGK